MGWVLDSRAERLDTCARGFFLSAYRYTGKHGKWSAIRVDRLGRDKLVFFLPASLSGFCFVFVYPVVPWSFLRACPLQREQPQLSGREV